MKINKSLVTALIAFLLIFGWFIINSGKSKDEAVSDSRPPALVEKQAKASALPQVVTRDIIAKQHPYYIELFGQTEAAREVSVKAETAGLVTGTPAKEGQIVAPETILCRQDVDARQAQLDQANALLRTRQLELEATLKLVERGYKSETQLLTAQSSLDSTLAMVKSAEIELDNVNMRAPFRGVFVQRLAEKGDYLAPGQPCGVLLELNPLNVIIQLTEDQLANTRTGQNTSVELATGETVSGKLTYIESRANPATRTFRAEIAVPNPKMKLRAGITATVLLDAGEQMAQLIPGQIMTLSDDGVLGVRYLDSQNIVRFAKVTTIDETADGLWVTGLDDQARIIVKGQDFVGIGVKTEPISEKLVSSAP